MAKNRRGICYCQLKISLLNPEVIYGLRVKWQGSHGITLEDQGQIEFWRSLQLIKMFEKMIKWCLRAD